jgi:hypothetical protein
MLLKYCDPGDMFAFSDEMSNGGRGRRDPQKVYIVTDSWEKCRALFYPFKTQSFSDFHDLSPYAERHVTLLRPTKFAIHDFS